MAIERYIYSDIALVIRQLTTPPVYPPNFGPPHAGFDIDALLAYAAAVGHDVDSLIAELNQLDHTVDALISGMGAVSHAIDSALSQADSDSFAVDSLLTEQPGTFIHGPGDGIFVTPPGVYFLNVYLWGSGGGGSSYGIPVGGSGGGGAGFTQQVNVPTIPGFSHSWAVQPQFPFVQSSFSRLSGSLTVDPGGQGDSLGGGIGGAGSNGDVNYSGGVGGQFGDVIGTTFGSGGGSSAGPAGNGISGQNATLSAPGQGGGQVSGMGAGGQGGVGLGTTLGLPGQYPGGGGGGQGYNPVTSPPVQAAGAGGLIIITWDASVHFVDACISGLGQDGFNIDGLIGLKGNVHHAIDALTAIRVLESYTINSTIAGLLSNHFAIDAEIGAKRSISHSVDALLASKKSATYSVNALLASKKSGTYSVDADLWKNYLYDLFTGAGTVALASHTMNLGPGWTVTAVFGATTDLVVITNHCTDNNGSGRSYVYGTSDAGSANHACDLTFSPAFTGFGQVFCQARYQDTSNFFQVNYDITGSSFILQSVVAGVVTTIGTGTFRALTAGTVYTLNITTTATTVSATISGPGITTTTIGPVANVLLATNTKFGFGTQRFDTANYFLCNMFSFRVY